MPQRKSQRKEEEVIGSCSFCQRPNTEVGTLVYGPGVFICRDCAKLALMVIADKPASAPRLPVWQQISDLDAVLDLLPKVAAGYRQVEDNLTGLVRRARELGATWTRIGEALGVTRQSAWERFSGEE